MALLRIPLLSDQVDPSQEAFLQSAGEAAATAARNPAHAVDVLGKLVKEHPQAPYLHYAYGLALATEGQTEEALAAQQRETEISPESLLPRIQITTLQLVLHQFAAALRSAQQGVALAPDSSAAHELLAKALEANGKHQQAADETRKAATLFPEKVRADEQTARLYGIPSGTTSTTSSGAAGNAKSGDANPAEWQQAMSDYASRRYPEAIGALKKWVEAKPGDGTAWAVMGLAEFELRDYDNALIHLQRGQQLGVGASAQAIELAKYRLGSLLIRKGQFEMATDLLGPLAGQPPLASEIQFALGLALLRIPSLPDDVDSDRHSLVRASGRHGAASAGQQIRSGFSQTTEADCRVSEQLRFCTTPMERRSIRFRSTTRRRPRCARKYGFRHRALCPGRGSLRLHCGSAGRTRQCPRRKMRCGWRPTQPMPTMCWAGPSQIQAIRARRFRSWNERAN